MIRWLLASSVRRAPRRLALATLGVAFPVAMLAATLLFVDAAARAMTPVALAPVQVQMRALATSLDVDMDAVGRRLAAVPGVTRVERFAAADVTVGTPGTAEPATARLFAVDPGYLRHHPWVRVAGGTLGGGAVLNEALRARPGFGAARALSIELPNGPRLATVPVTGTVDLRQATAWFAVPTGEVQGDVAVVPRAVVVDYATFERALLPALRRALGPDTSVLNPGLTDLPPVDLEAHVAVDHAAYPADPGRAAAWSERLRQELERQAPGEIVVADDAAEFLALARDDATNATVLFLLLGIPGVLVAAALGLAAESALAEANRREEALLRLRGASEGQLARLTAAHATLAGAAGAVVGLAVAVATVSAVNGRPVWREVPAGRLAVSLALALCAGAAVVGVRLLRLRRAGRRSEVATQRRLLERGWAPTWRRARLDLVAVAAGATILLVHVVTGGLRRTAVEGLTLSLFFYQLLAPIALWLGITLLAVRGLLAASARRARPGLAPPARSWWGATLRWLGRRPARTAVALVLGTLAVAFGTEVVAFVATYQAAREADTAAAFGADLRLAPTGDRPTPLPPLGPAVAATSPIRYVPVRAGTDRKTIVAVDPASYPRTVAVAPRMLAGSGVDALARDPAGVLVAQEIADGFGVGPGDPLPVTVFPDDDEKARNLTLRVVGVFRSFPPTDLLPELVVPDAGLPPSLLPPPDFHLARVAPGQSAAAVAGELDRDGLAGAFTVTTFQDQVRREHRSLTALNLAGLSRIESVGAGLAAAVGVAVLGAFLVLERRRELAILRTIGAGPAQALTGPTLEGMVATLGSLAIGVPLGLGLAVLAGRVLGLFFFQPPPLLAVPALPLAALGLLVVGASALALGVALAAAGRRSPATVLREP
ncbi:MAG TPA: FtsX-like permease family protein [Actinomycetes bacterium]|nr:FtsX-like permease family protein [Actinomycetes bacterium]